MQNSKKAIILLYLISTLAVVPSLDAKNDIQNYYDSNLEKPESSYVLVFVVVIAAMAGAPLLALMNRVQETAEVTNEMISRRRIYDNTTLWSFNANGVGQGHRWRSDGAFLHATIC